MKIMFETENPVEAAKFLDIWLQVEQRRVEADPAPETILPEEPEPVFEEPEVVPEEKPEPKRKNQRRMPVVKEVPPELVDTSITPEPLPEIEIPEEPEPTATTELTIDDVRKAVDALNSRKGLGAARDAVMQFGANRISDVDPSQYAALIAHCGAV